MTSATSPPRPSDPEWDTWVETQLDKVEYDTSLGKQLAKDALKVSEGTLSKAQFHERHSEAVRSEFGIDERPTKEAAQAASEDNATHPKVPETRSTSRRRVLQAIGTTAAAGVSTVAGCVGDSGNDTRDRESQNNGIADSIDGDARDEDGIVDEIPHQTQLGMVVDTDRCVACLQCSLACKEENDTDIGVHWPYVFRYADDLAGERREGHLTRHCQHCSEPSCAFVCPTQARYKRTDDGVVLTDYDLCIGCRYCQVACPYGVNYLGEERPTELSDGFDGSRVGRDGRRVGGPPPANVMGKCTFCVHRQDADDPELQGTTACAERCPFGVIHFGDMNNPHSDPRRYLREDVPEKNHFRLLDGVGNEPNIVFVGHEPSKDAESIQGPVAYEDHGMVDGAYKHSDDGADQG